jgi:hypothetical protein
MRPMVRGYFEFIKLLGTAECETGKCFRLKLEERLCHLDELHGGLPRSRTASQNQATDDARPWNVERSGGSLEITFGEPRIQECRRFTSPLTQRRAELSSASFTWSFLLKSAPEDDRKGERARSTWKGYQGVGASLDDEKMLSANEILSNIFLHKG